MQMVQSGPLAEGKWEIRRLGPEGGPSVTMSCEPQAFHTKEQGDQVAQLQSLWQE